MIIDTIQLTVSSEMTILTNGNPQVSLDGRPLRRRHNAGGRYFVYDQGNLRVTLEQGASFRDQVLTLDPPASIVVNGDRQFDDVKGLNFVGMTMQINSDAADPQQQNSTITGLQQQNSQLKSTIASLQQQNSQLKSTITSLQQQNSQLNSTITSLQQQNGRLSSTVTDLQQRSSQLNSTITDLQSSLKQDRQRLAELQQQARMTDTELLAAAYALKARYVTLAKKSNDLQKDVDTDQRTISEMHSCEFISSGELDELEQDYMEISARVDRLIERLRQISIDAAHVSDQRSNDLNQREGETS